MFGELPKDVVDIIDVVNKMSITANTRENDYIYLKKENKNNLQFRETTQTLGQISQYIPLQYGVPVQISIPGTSLLISNSDKNILTWNASPIVFSTEKTTFTVRSLDPKKNKDKIAYGDVFYITYGSENSIVVINTKFSRLEVVKDSLDQIDINKQFLYKFTLESNMMGYYCDGRECKQIPIKDIETNGPIGRYKNVTVCRDPNCWGVCKYLELGTNSYSLLSDKPPVIKTSKHVVLLFMFGLLSMIVFILSIIIIKRFFF